MDDDRQRVGQGRPGAERVAMTQLCGPERTSEPAITGSRPYVRPGVMEIAGDARPASITEGAAMSWVGRRCG
jgi:hypothetical protein